MSLQSSPRSLMSPTALMSPKMLQAMWEEPSDQIAKMRSTVMGPKAHRLPGHVMWLITLLTALAMALVNFATIFLIEYSVRVKFGTMQWVIRELGIVMGVFTLIVISVLYALFGVTLIECFAPICGGSGLPENKCFLNGSSVPGFYTKRTLRVRIATVILSNAAGFPVGREGPTVVIGSNVAFLISEYIARPYVKEWIQCSNSGSLPTLIVDEERFAEATRIACAVGGACGMAMIFNAPFGGLLYMFEEMTAVSWPLELTFRIFVATMVCAMASYGLLNLVGSDIFEFVIFVWTPPTETWDQKDLPLFVIMSAVLGVLTSFHTRGCLYMSVMRQRVFRKFARWQPFAKMSETILFCAFCAVVCAGTALMAECREKTEVKSRLEYVIFNCRDDQYNPIASLLVNTSHSSVKFLFAHNNSGELGAMAALASFVAYGALNILLTGLPVPGGAFTATMLLGGLFGRFFGELGVELGLIETVSGIYAVVGSAAMLCGFKQMTLAVVLIVVECVNNLTLGPIVMLGVTVSMVVNRLVNARGHDEEIILRKRLPFLEGDAPPELDGHVAINLRDDLPRGAILEPSSRASVVESALKFNNISDFPVVEEASSRCVGIITRFHLEALIRAYNEERGSSSNGRTPLSRAFLDDPFRAPEDMDKACLGLFARAASTGASGELGTFNLSQIMDSTPFTILEDMPAPRLYPLFAKAGERAAVVVSKDGKFRGVISRAGLIAAARSPPIK